MPCTHTHTPLLAASLCLVMMVVMSEPASKHVPQHQTRPPCPAQGHQTPLHRAAAAGNSDAMAALVQGGCALNLQERDGNTALHEVSWHGFYQCVKLLVKAGADVNVKNKAGNTALHLACQNAHAQSARVLLLGGSAADAKNKIGDTCLHVSSRYNNVKVLKLLLSTLCSVTEQNQEGDTALHTAAALNHKRSVQLLLEAGGDGNVRNNAGRTALDRARENNSAEAALVLARAPQVHRFMRGRTIRKQRERVRAERRTQSVNSVDTLAKRESASSAEDNELDSVPRATRPRATRPTVFTTGYHCHPHRRRKMAALTAGGPHGRGSGALNEDHAGSGEGVPSETQRRKGLLPSGNCREPPKTRAYQLYTLFRDRHGTVRQAPARGSHCRARFRKLGGQIRATQEEMKWHIVSLQDQFNVQLGRLHRRNLRQIEVLDMVNQERAATEREAMLYRIDQHAEQAREEAIRSQQAAMSRDLKRWCMSRMRGMDLPPSPEPYALLQSPSVEVSGAESDLLESTLPLLDVVPGDDSSSNSSSLATYVSGLPSLPSSSTLANDDHNHQTPEGLPVSSADSCWRLPGVTLRGSVVPPAVVGLGRARGRSTSGSSSSSLFAVPAKPGKAEILATRGQRLGHRSYGWACKRRLSEPVLARGRATAGTSTDNDAMLGVCTDRQTLIQERNHRQAVEVTQRFFEAVSAQLERWYESKVQEAKRQAELRAQQDMRRLLQRITALEEEIQRLTANDKA
ncbi:ankyrin repeat domain-containing protein 6 isoform X1 [Gadus macrocephalus]|uniref:ankyrin repeat domain-containing protein 6 isoform X1 n=2 Tax=Gadus macrocephalus TaxID=80720 RepID=UPI0028CB2F8C|nr:ankyrin repeat domain-containing protein 6 isoform X1 [Gadus macrocephalus]